MKVLYVATPNSIGHHKSYFLGVSKAADDYVLVTERYCPDINCKQYYDERLNFGTKSLKEYFKVINLIKKICKEEKPDIIHIQCGDNFYRFFGLGLNTLGCRHIVMTFHHIGRSTLRDISMKCIYQKIAYGVVHTNFQIEMLGKMGIKNVFHIEYPVFNKPQIINSDDAKKFFGLSANIKTLAVIGSTRKDKGLDILLSSLKKVDCPFQLLIAGSEGEITESCIDHLSSDYQEKVTKYIKYLDKTELTMALNAADIIVLPYRKCFEGASGPLGEGCVMGKTIVGPDHGSLGDIIKNNHLGFTFEAENVELLSTVINESLIKSFVPDDYYKKYQESLSEFYFVEKYRSLFNKIITNEET